MPERKILVVDNSPVILKIIVSILEGQGCVVRTAPDGLAALDVLASFRPDIIVTDLVMPKIDGYKLCSIFRNTPEYRDIFLIVLTGIAMEEELPIKYLGADICIAKGPAVTMKKHLLEALAKFDSGLRGECLRVEGMSGLHARSVTAELLVSKRHNEIILANMVEGVVELNHEGRIVMMNAASLRLFTLPEEQILGRRLADFLPEKWGDQLRDWIESFKTDKKQAHFSCDYGDPIFLGKRQVTLHITPVPEEGQFFLIGLIQDVTQAREMEETKRRLEERLQHIRKLDAMAAMASGISHDFNNLLTIINGNVEMAKILSGNNEVRNLLDDTGTALHLTGDLIRQFTTFADTYLPVSNQVEIVRLVKEQLAEDFSGSGIDYSFLAPDDLVFVQVDSNLMRQVFHNLFQNAIEACQNNGKVTVSIDYIDGRDEAARTGQLLADGRFVRITVCDSGVGIAEQVQHKVFDPYFSTKQKGAQKGMGLGLTIVHAIIAKHNGQVWLRSETDSGCTVSLYLPASPGEPEQAGL